MIQKRKIQIIKYDFLSNFKDKDIALMDCSLASGNIMLAAEAIGLGSLWTEVYPYPERQEIVRNATSIPPNIIPLNVIPVGHPQGDDIPKDKYNPTKIHNEKW